MKPFIHSRLLVALLPILSLLLTQASCSEDVVDTVDTTPDFLLQGWIWPIASNSVRTYDFTQAQAADRRTVEIRAWQNIGTLGWQSYQSYTAVFEADDHHISMSTATGYPEEWSITSIQSETMVVMNQSGASYTWYNCSAAGWPALIYSSNRGCR